MSLFNVDFYDRELVYAHHDLVEDPSLDIDFLSPSASTISIKKTKNVPGSGFVHFSGDLVFDGIIESVSDDDDVTNVTVKPLVCLFDNKVPFDTALQNSSTTLEAAIKSRIDSFWISNGDALQNLPAISFITSGTQVSQWTLDLDPKSDENTWNLVNLFRDVISPAFERYGIVTDGKLDFTNLRINFTIGSVSDSIIIDADNETVEVIEFMADKLDGDINKLVIVDSADYTQTTTYYLHPNGTYNTTNNNRITPVIFDYVEVTSSNDTPFSTAAQNAADSQFGKIAFKNYVELEVMPNDKLITPYELPIGIKAKIYQNGRSVDTILTGIKLDEYVTLAFGTVRLDYTKQKQGG